MQQNKYIKNKEIWKAGVVIATKFQLEEKARGQQLKGIHPGPWYIDQGKKNNDCVLKSDKSKGKTVYPVDKFHTYLSKKVGKLKTRTLTD